jgi:hypothetical protein
MRPWRRLFFRSDAGFEVGDRVQPMCDDWRHVAVMVDSARTGGLFLERFRPSGGVSGDAQCGRFDGLPPTALA